MANSKDVTTFGVNEKEFLKYFEKGCSKLSVEFEARRKRFIKKLFIRSITLVLSVFFLFSYPKYCYILITASIGLAAIIEYKISLTKRTPKEILVSLFSLRNILNISFIFFSIIMAYAFDDKGYKFFASIIIVTSLFAYSLQPIFRYRRHKQKVTTTENNVLITEIKISLKELIFTQLITYFGNFKFKRIGAVSLANIHKAPIIPEYDRYIAEDLITGVFENTKIEISEGMLTKEIDGREVAMFRGLLVVMDISNSDLVLRNSFRGQTIIIEEKNNNSDKKLSKKHYKGFEKINLFDESKLNFEILTTNKSETRQLVTEAMLQRISRLSNTISRAEHQIHHNDDKVMIYVNKICTKLGELTLKIFMNLINIISIKLISKIVLDPAPISKMKSEIPYNIESLNKNVQCCFYDDKVLLTVPYKKDLFEPNSIFEPAIIQEDIHVLYSVMRLTYEIIHGLLEEKAKPSFSFERAVGKAV